MFKFSTSTTTETMKLSTSLFILSVTLIVALCVNSITMDPIRSSTSSSDDKIDCPADRSFNPCGSACPLTCEQPRKRKCNRMCVPGCFCHPGLYENARGVCVTLDQCQL